MISGVGERGMVRYVCVLIALSSFECYVVCAPYLVNYIIQSNKIYIDGRFLNGCKNVPACI